MQIIGLKGVAEIKPNDDLCAVILAALEVNQVQLDAGDLVVLAQKIVSKSENRYVTLADVKPSQKAIALADEVQKEATLVQLVLDESVEVVRKRPGVVVVEHKQGYVHANAGIDRSNLPASEKERVLLLPKDANASAEKLRWALSKQVDCDLGVIINDSAGRAWREGTVGFAIGTAGFNPLVNLVGQQDRNGREMETTQVAVADELAAAASFIMGQADEGMPIVIVKGANVTLGEFDARVMIRDKQFDLFR